MVVLDPLSNALSAILNAERRAKPEVVVWPASKLILNVLKVMQSEGYIGEIEYIDDGKWGKIRIQLLGRINKVGTIKPRFSIKLRELEQFPHWVRRYLPSYNIEVLIVSTPYGVFSHKEAIARRTGGVRLAYVY